MGAHPVDGVLGAFEIDVVIPIKPVVIDVIVTGNLEVRVLGYDIRAFLVFGSQLLGRREMLCS